LSTDKRSFLASAHNSGPGDSWIEGWLTFERFQLRFQSDAFTTEVPLVRVKIELDKAAGGQVCFRDTNDPDFCVYTFDPDVLEHPALRQQPATNHQIEALRSFSELKRRLKITGYFVGGFALVAIVVSLLLGIMVRSLVARIPPEVEQEIGDSALEELKSTEIFLKDEKLRTRLEKAAAPLVAGLASTGVNFKFYVVQEALPNAFALPGGHVIVTTGLLEMTDQPDEIAAVIAHEIAHVRLKHNFREIISSAGPYLIFSVFMRGGGGVGSVLGGGSGLLVAQSFSQQYELEADSAGWDYLVASRIDPRSMARVLTKLEREQQRHPGLHAKLGAFSSHPATSKRIRRLETKWRKFKEKSLFESR
jgi:predicted Zn-dependent protease